MVRFGGRREGSGFGQIRETRMTVSRAANRISIPMKIDRNKRRSRRCRLDSREGSTPERTNVWFSLEDMDSTEFGTSGMERTRVIFGSGTGRGGGGGGIVREASPPSRFSTDSRPREGLEALIQFTQNLSKTDKHVCLDCGDGIPASLIGNAKRSG